MTVAVAVEPVQQPHTEIAFRGQELRFIQQVLNILIDREIQRTDSELIGAVRSVLDDEEMRSGMIKTGRRLASRFREEVVAYNLLSCYRRVGVDVRG